MDVRKDESLDSESVKKEQMMADNFCNTKPKDPVAFYQGELHGLDLKENHKTGTEMQAVGRIQDELHGLSKDAKTDFLSGVMCKGPEGLNPIYSADGKLQSIDLTPLWKE